jgi:type III restriction enzyme
VLESRSLVEGALTGHSAGLGAAAQAPFVFETAGERVAADYTLRLIQDRYERELKKGVQQLSEPTVKARITADIEAVMAPTQAALDLGEPRVNVAKVVDVVVAKVAELTIAIPEIVVLPTHDATFGFRDFDLSGLEAIAKQPIADEIMVQKLRDESRTYLARSMEGAREERPENYIVRTCRKWTMIARANSSLSCPARWLAVCGPIFRQTRTSRMCCWSTGRTLRASSSSK